MLPRNRQATLASARLLATAHAPNAQPARYPTGEPGASPALPSFAAELARAMAPLGHGTTTRTADPRATTELNLSTPVNNPEFVPRLTGELAVLARDGVQEARINVHPVELGPISVQISLDGAAAQVHLAVDNAQTRELLEQAMPSLAAALRENGLTLTGGGVFQQARQNAREVTAAVARGLLDARRRSRDRCRLDNGGQPLAPRRRARHLRLIPARDRTDPGKFGRRAAARSSRCQQTSAQVAIGRLKQPFSRLGSRPGFE